VRERREADPFRAFLLFVEIAEVLYLLVLTQFRTQNRYAFLLKLL